MEIKNKKAYFDYFIDEELECGIVLTGTEIKAIRKGSVNLKDSFIKIKNNELYITNMYIAQYEKGTIYNHDEYRDRKLLLHKKEIKKLKEKVQQTGYTLIALKIYLRNNIAKVLVGVCKGKKLYDKRNVLKEKALNKTNMQRIKW